MIAWLFIIFHSRGLLQLVNNVTRMLSDTEDLSTKISKLTKEINNLAVDKWYHDMLSLDISFRFMASSHRFWEHVAPNDFQQGHKENKQVSPSKIKIWTNFLRASLQTCLRGAEGCKRCTPVAWAKILRLCEGMPVSLPCTFSSNKLWSPTGKLTGRLTINIVRKWKKIVVGISCVRNGKQVCSSYLWGWFLCRNETLRVLQYKA